MTLDELNESDFSENEENYSNLVEAVSQLDSSRRVKPPTRKGLSTAISEFHIPKTATKQANVIHVNELAEALKRKSESHIKIRNKVKSVIKTAKTLSQPLEAPVAERIKRRVGYENVKEQLRRWNAIVAKHRVADHLNFPLKQSRVTLQSSHQFLNKFKPKTPLEVEISKILGTEAEEVSDNEDEINDNSKFPLTFEEMLEKKKELARIRAKLSYREAKAHRQSKIKSKKYHRFLKREKIKEQLKEFEQLQKTNPVAALKKLEELDKSRAQERASLRHRNTGKWARNIAVRAKYNAESRKILAEQLKLSRDLTAKVKKVDSDEEDSDNETPEGTQNTFTVSKDNPWAPNTASEVADFASSCKKYWDNKNKEKHTKLDDGANAESQTSLHITAKENGFSDNSEHIKKIVSVQNNGIGEPVTVESAVKTKTDSDQKIVKSKKHSLNNGQSENGDVGKDVTTVKNTKVLKKAKVRGGSDTAYLEKKSVGKLKTVKESKKEKFEPIESKPREKLKMKVHSTSGSWFVDEVNERKRKSTKSVDDLFEDLDRKLASKASKKLKRLEKKFQKKKGLKVKEKVESDLEGDDDLEFKTQPSRPEIDKEMEETTGRETEAASSKTHLPSNFETPESEKAPLDIDPKKFIEVKQKELKTKIPDNLTGGDADCIDDEDETQHLNIVEAFGGDDVMEEFEEMKKEEEEKTKLETNNVLPGWGSWGGTDIKPDERKTKMNTINVKLPPRKDKDKKDLIIRERTNLKLLEHMVKDIPHPFKSVGAFESNMRHPIGREWNPETAHRKFIKKPVETLMGTIIEPMDEAELVQLKREEKSLYRGKKKQKK